MWTINYRVLIYSVLCMLNKKAKNGEKVFKKAIEVIKGECPEKRCKWCERTD